MREKLICDYKECLTLICTESAFLEDYKRKYEKGVVSEEEIAPHLSFMRKVCEEFLELKKKLGFDGELDFMNNVKFLGFEFKNGCLMGDYSNLEPIVASFLAEFDEDRVYQYEVGMLIMFHYLRQTGKDKGISFNNKKKGFIAKLRNIFKRRRKEK